MRTVIITLTVAVYVAMGVFPYLATVLFAPLTGVAFLLAAWALGLVGMLLLARRRSWWVLAGPLLAAAFWALVATIGERAFGWMA